jgi:glyoxylase-like metal-dependent hydrolase (beta-lactamase superfamily II)
MDIESKLTDFPDGITAIDTDYVRPRLDASHLLVDSGRAAFVDTGTTLSVPNLLATLDARGIGREEVDWVLTTHVHLDHAGGAGELMRHLPNARCVVHPRGARHLVDPAKLIAGSIAVYGEAAYHRLYGEIIPIPEERIFIPGDGERISVGRRSLKLIHTMGHALHHYCIVDLDTRRIFTGDNFGVSYRDLDVDGREFIFPTTTPVHFDPEAMHVSIDRLMTYRPVAMYLTHYSQVLEVERLAAQLKQRIDHVSQLARSLADAPQRGARLRAEMFGLMSAWLDEHGFPGDSAQRHRLLDADIDLNAQGLEVWLDRAA